MKRKSLAAIHPELALEADGWDPDTVTPGSHRKVAWKCQSGHSWEALIYSRSSGIGCPVCAGKTVVSGLNDLKTTHPEIAQEANGWNPSEFTFGSSKKLAWRCASGHEWNAPIYNRTKGSGCPFCAGKQAWPGFNDMATTHPALAAQAYGWDPTKYIAGTGKKLRWLCSNGHEWMATGNSRVVNGTGCPICSNQTTISGINDLMTTHPSLAAEAFGWDPTMVNPGSNQVKTWKCQASAHVWKSAISNRTRRGDGCPVCSGRKVVSGENDLATLYPDLAREAVDWEPSKSLRFANKRVAWECKKGHMWSATTSSRIAGSGCPYCAGQKVIRGLNDLATLNPELGAEADGWNPTTLMSQSNRKVGWRCSQGHKWEASVASRTNDTGCPYCSGNLVSVGFNDLATTHPDIAAEADGWDPRTVSKGSIAKKLWLCSSGHLYEATPNNRCNGKGCPVCIGHKVQIGFNDLATTNPGLAAEADGWDPTTLTQGSNKKVGWKCTFGHQWIAQIASRSDGVGCPICSGKLVLAGFNDLATTYPDVAAQADGWDPTTITAGSGVKKKWICSEGHRWVAVVGSRAKRNGGCPTCATSGYDPNSDAWLYFLQHELWGLLQIGITNVPDIRLGYHKRIGWEILELRGPMPGDVTRQWEQDILHSLKHRGVKLSPDHIAQFSGYTEAWVQEDFPARSLSELMQMVHDDES